MIKNECVCSDCSKMNIVDLLSDYFKCKHCGKFQHKNLYGGSGISYSKDETKVLMLRKKIKTEDLYKNFTKRVLHRHEKEFDFIHKHFKEQYSFGDMFKIKGQFYLNNLNDYLNFLKQHKSTEKLIYVHLLHELDYVISEEEKISKWYLEIARTYNELLDMKDKISMPTEYEKVLELFQLFMSIVKNKNNTPDNIKNQTIDCLNNFFRTCNCNLYFLIVRSPEVFVGASKQFGKSFYSEEDYRKYGAEIPDLFCLGYENYKKHATNSDSDIGNLSYNFYYNPPEQKVTYYHVVKEDNIKNNENNVCEKNTNLDKSTNGLDIVLSGAIIGKMFVEITNMLDMSHRNEFELKTILELLKKHDKHITSTTLKEIYDFLEANHRNYKNTNKLYYACRGSFWFDVLNIFIKTIKSYGAEHLIKEFHKNNTNEKIISEFKEYLFELRKSLPSSTNCFDEYNQRIEMQRRILKHLYEYIISHEKDLDVANIINYIKSENKKFIEHPNTPEDYKKINTYTIVSETFKKIINTYYGDYNTKETNIESQLYYPVQYKQSSDSKISIKELVDMIGKDIVIYDVTKEYLDRIEMKYSIGIIKEDDCFKLVFKHRNDDIVYGGIDTLYKNIDVATKIFKNLQK